MNRRWSIRMVSILSLTVMIAITLFQGSAVSAAKANLSNAGFEAGLLTGWTTVSAPDFAGVTLADSFTSPYQGIYMARLGQARIDNQPIGPNSIYQDFTVSQDTFSFTYNLFTYEASGFDKFHYEVTDLATGDVIATFQRRAWGSDYNLKSTGWQVVTFDVSAYLGNEVRFEVDCGGTGDTHFSTWAYIDTADIIPPVTTAASITPSPNPAGWNNSGVTVSLFATDEAGGSGVQSVFYRINGGPFVSVASSSVTLPFDQEGTSTLMYYGTDNSNNIETPNTLVIKIDKTPPTLSASQSPAPNGAGWNKGDVTLNFTASDSLSGISSIPDPVVISTEGANQSVTRSVTDVAGNSTSVTVGNINIDKTPPSAVSTQMPFPNGNGWNKTDVQVHFAASDAGSGVSGASTYDVTISAPTPGQSVAHTFTDVAGNTASAAAPNPIKIDKTAPTVVWGAVSPAPNAGGWNNTNVTVSYTIADDLSGAASSEGSLIFSADGTNQTQTVTVADNAGNTATFTSPAVNIDRSAPIVTAAQTPPPNANGWNNTDVTVQVTASDSLSGIAGPAAESITLTSNMMSGSAVFTFTDQAGNVTTANIGAVVKIDKTPPTISWGTAVPAPNAAGWNNSSVTITYTIADDLSGLDGAGGSGQLVFSADGANQTKTVTVTDKAGNTATFTSPVVNIDRIAPSVTTAQTPAPNGNGWNNTDVTVQFVVTDSLSGVVGSSSSVVTLTSSSSPSDYTFSDQAGNIVTASIPAIRIDRTPPTLAWGAVTPAPNAAGWNNSVVTVSYATSDSLSGLDAGSASGQLTFNNNGANQSLPITITDLAGNSATFTSPSINIDTVAPVVSLTRTPANGNGWNNGSVTVSFSATDVTSGVADTASFSVTLSTDGAGQVATHIFADVAGNVTSATETGINIDKTPPILTFGALTPAPDSAGWNNTDVTVSFTAIDALSLVDIVTPASPLLFNTDGANQTKTVSVTDKAGNTVTFTSPVVNINKSVVTITTITIVSPQSRDYLNSDDITLDFSATSTPPGAVSVNATLDGVPVTSGQVIDLAAMTGNHTLVVTAVDSAGATTTSSINFSVLAVTTMTVTVKIEPVTLNLGSKSDRNAVTANIDFQSGHDGRRPDPATVRLNVLGTLVPAQLDDDCGDGHGHSGVIKFDRQAVIDALQGHTGNVSLTVTGDTEDGISFTGSDTIKVINQGSSETVKTSVVIKSPQARDYDTSEKITLDFSVSPALPYGAKLTASLDGKAVTDGQIISLARMTGNHTLAVTVTDKGGIVARSTVVFRVGIAATARFSTGIFDPGSHGDKDDVSVQVQFLAGYDVRQIDLSTVNMNVLGKVIRGSLSSSTTGDSNHDGVTDRTIKFDRDAIGSALHGKSGYVTVTITGKLKDGTSFTGTCKVKVTSAAGDDDDRDDSHGHDDGHDDDRDSRD